MRSGTALTNWNFLWMIQNGNFRNTGNCYSSDKFFSDNRSGKQAKKKVPFGTFFNVQMRKCADVEMEFANFLILFAHLHICTFDGINPSRRAGWIYTITKLSMNLVVKLPFLKSSFLISCW